MAIINGNNSANTLNGTAVADTIDGMGGNDTINGLGGDDILRGGSGNDTVNGGVGNDTITGGSGDDALNGGDGNDTFVYATFDGLDTFAGGTGTDRIVLAAAGTTLALRSGFGAGNSIEAIDGVGNSTIRGASSADTYNFSATTLTGIASIDVGAGNDNVTGSSGADRIRGGLGDDTIAGGGGADTLEGDDGADTLTGGAGADRLIGGTGNDFFAISTLSGGADRIADFGNGADTLRLSVLPASGVTASNLASFVRAQRVDGNVVVRVDTNGATGGSVFTDAAVLEGFTGTTVRVQIGSQFFNVPIPANRNPTLDDDEISVDEDATTGNLLTTLLTGDTDPDGNVLRVTGVTQGSKGTVFFDAGTAALGDETVIYAADGGVLDALSPGQTTTDTFTYSVSDGNGGIDHGNVTVTINGTADAPRLTPAVEVYGIADGYVVTSVGSSANDGATALIQQSDGKLVAVGQSSEYPSGGFTLVRYHADGSIDGTFGGDGIVTTDFGSSGAEARDAIQQPNGKLVVVGQARNPNSGEDTFALVRFHVDGRLDMPFGGGDGIVMPDFGPGVSVLSEGVIRQPDGKLIVAGSGRVEADSDFALARFTADGTLDATFGGGDGIVTTDFGGVDELSEIIRQSDGRLVVAGVSGNNLAVARYSADGTLDTTFSGDGRVLTSIESDGFFVRVATVVRQTDGKLVVAGDTSGGFYAVRYNVDGTLDATFGSGGIVSTPLELSAGTTIQQADGKFVVVGSANSEEGLQIALARYNADGSLDASFGNGGLVTHHLASDLVFVSFDIVEQPGGKLVVAGRSEVDIYPEYPFSNSDFALARFNADGTLDTTFGPGGMRDQSIDEGLPFSIAIPANLFADPDGDSLALQVTQADGGPLPSWLTFDSVTQTLSGTAPEPSGNVQVRLVATDPSGLSVEDVFEIATNGAPRAQGVRTSSLSGYLDAAASIVQPDGAIVVVGWAEVIEGVDFAVVRYLADGTLDPSFGDGDGIVATNFAPYSNEMAMAVARQADGKLVVAGQEQDYYGGTFESVLKLARYNVDGTLDLTFGDGDGVVATPSPINDGHLFGSITLLSDGKVVALGATNIEVVDVGSVTVPLVVRFNADGTLDTTFGGGTGYVAASALHGSRATAAIEQPGGKLLVVGAVTGDPADPREIPLLMYNADGSLDNSFGGGDGIAMVSSVYGSRDVLVRDVVQQSDGKIVLASSAPGTAVGIWDSALARLNPDGTLDATFGVGGYVLNDDRVSLAGSVIQQADGKLVALAGAGGEDEDGIALVRYNADGSLDTTFGDDGVVTVTGVRDSGANLRGADLSQQADGKLVVSGAVFWNLAIEDWYGEFAAIRFNIDGTIDESFRGLSARTVTEEAPFSIALPAGLFVDPDGDSLDYTLTLSNGDPLPAWITFDAATNTISGTPPSGAPDVLLRITATDPHDLSAFHEFTLDVTESILAGAITSDASTAAPVDLIDLVASANPDWTAFADFHTQVAQLGADVFIDLYGGSGITLLGVSAASLAADDARA